jgi:arginine:ornithine antiporter/lysine permease
VSAPRTQLSRSALIALVVGSMIGAGIFTLPTAFARSTGVVGAIVAWCIAGNGMLMLAFVFQTLSRRKPELDAGIYAYAKAGFGNYMGFTAAFGYWVACCLAQVALLVLIKAALGQFFPAFGDGTTLAAIAAASAMVWGVHFLNNPFHDQWLEVAGSGGATVRAAAGFAGNASTSAPAWRDETEPA